VPRWRRRRFARLRRKQLFTLPPLYVVSGHRELSAANGRSIFDLLNDWETQIVIVPMGK